jgi:hypothetical protein
MFVVGLFAMLLHLLAGAGLVRAGASGNAGFVPGICGNHATPETRTPHAPAGSIGNHDCCKLCAAGAPPILFSSAIAVSPAPTLVMQQEKPASATPNRQPASAHRPRGPPAVG